MKKAYLYSRVSKLSQKNGKGLERQRDMAIEFLKYNAPEYDIAEIFDDAGKSAYYAKHLKEKAGFGGFLKACEDGAIEPDSMIVIESVDRLSRQGIDLGMEIFNSLKKFKINVGITKYNLIINYQDKNCLDKSMQLLTGLWLGHEESKQKSTRILKTFDIKLRETLETGKKFKTGIRPAWIDLNEAGNDFVLNKKKSEIVKLIFNLKVNEQLGVYSITKFLNKNNIHPFSNKEKWTPTSVTNILKSRAAIGEWIPKKRCHDETNLTRSEDKPKLDEDGNVIVVKNYYPPTIDENIFFAAQNSFDVRISGAALKSKRAREFKNLFRYLTFCKCGSPMNFKTNYLCCQNIECDSRSTRYDKFEEITYALISNLKFMESTILNTQKRKSNINILETNKKLETAIKAKSNIGYAITKATSHGAINELVKKLEKTNKDIETIELEIKSQALTMANDSTPRLDIKIDLNDKFQREKYNRTIRNYIENITLDTQYKFADIEFKNNPSGIIRYSLESRLFITAEKYAPHGYAYTQFALLAHEVSLYKLIVLFKKHFSGELTKKQLIRKIRDSNLTESYKAFTDNKTCNDLSSSPEQPTWLNPKTIKQFNKNFENNITKRKITDYTIEDFIYFDENKFILCTG